MKKRGLIAVLLCFSIFVYAQNSLTASFSDFGDQPIKLMGYSGFDTYVIDSTMADKNGVFKLSFAKADYGMGYLLSEHNKSYIILMAKNENLQLSGENFEFTEHINILNGKQNRLFSQYATEHARREQSIGAWDYLSKIYSRDSLFAIHKTPKQAIALEKKRLKNEDSLFLANIPKESYAHYYLPLRKLVGSVSTIAQYRSDEIPSTIAMFRALDYTDPYLFKSGLLKNTIESHFWLIENSGHSLDAMYDEMQISIDRILENLIIDQQKLNAISAYLFKFLEKRSLFTAAEYLAIRLLNEKSCTLNNNLASQLEGYRAMKKGNIAPNITFAGDILVPNTIGIQPNQLSDIEAKYKVVVFGAGWCPQCAAELQSIAQHYKKWRQYGLEVIFISLDEDQQIFTNFTEPFPFISICDYKKWDGQAAKDYHIFATPTLYLLSGEHEILLKPNSVSQLDAWVDWYLVKGNK